MQSLNADEIWVFTNFTHFQSNWRISLKQEDLKSFRLPKEFSLSSNTENVL